MIEKKKEEMKRVERTKELKTITKVRERLEKRQVTLDERLEKKYGKLGLQMRVMSEGERAELPLPEGEYVLNRSSTLAETKWVR